MSSSPSHDPLSPPPVGIGTTGRVTQNEIEGPEGCWQAPPISMTPDELRDARCLPLSAVPKSPGAVALVADLTRQVVDREATAQARRKGRRQAGLGKLEGAVGAIVGGVLRRWGRERPESVFRTRTSDDFSGGPVGVRQFLPAIDGLLALGLLNGSEAIRYGAFSFGDGDIFAGRAPRYWPSPALLEAAEAHGLTPATIGQDFGDTIPTVPPKVPDAVRVFALRQRTREDKQPLSASRLGNAEARIREEVEAVNAFAAEHTITGCLPPRWSRVFTEGLMLGGRWQALGRESVYQRMPEAERLAHIEIDGERVAEADVKASHLSILHGLLGLPLPEGDPYEISGVPRWVVKAWVTATLGKGTPVKQWAKRTTKENPNLHHHDPREVGRLVCDRYPFLRQPAQAVASAAGLERLGHLGKPEKLLTHRLMAVEAEALTGAMRYLRDARGVLALPIHDGLLVPLSGAGHVGAALESAFAYFAKVRVRWTIEPPLDRLLPVGVVPPPDMPRPARGSARGRPGGVGR